MKLGNHANRKSTSGSRLSKRRKHRGKALWRLAFEGHYRKVRDWLGDVGYRLFRWVCGYPLDKQSAWYRHNNCLGIGRGGLKDPRSWRRGHSPGVDGLDAYERDPSSSVHMITLLKQIRKESNARA